MKTSFEWPFYQLKEYFPSIKYDNIELEYDINGYKFERQFQSEGFLANGQYVIGLASTLVPSHLSWQIPIIYSDKSYIKFEKWVKEAYPIIKQNKDRYDEQESAWGWTRGMFILGFFADSIEYNPMKGVNWEKYKTSISDIDTQKLN
jgi:hypothetical protein